MSDDDYDDTEDEDEPEPQVDIPGLRKQARKASKLEKELAAERAAREKDAKELAVRRAGLDLTERQIRALYAAHDGELTPESLRETAIELNFASAAPETRPEEEAADRLRQAAAGADAPAADAKARLVEETTDVSEQEFWAKARAAGAVIQ